MADVAAQPFINFGQQAAEIGQTKASTALTGEQARGAGQQADTATMNNEIQRASMPLIMRSMQEAYADQSSGNAGNQERAAERSGVNAEDGGWASRNGSIEDSFRNQNFVEPVTQQEQAMLRYGTALSMSPNNAAAGKALIDRMQTQRQMRIDQQTAHNQLRNGNIYDSATAVHNTDPEGDTPGAALQSLDAIDKPDAAAIRKLATDSSGKFDVAKADDMAREHAGHIAAVSHLYSGRPTKDVNGQLVDEKTDQPVTGQQHLYTGSTGDQLAKDREYAKEPIEVPLTTGGTTKMARWQAPEGPGGGFGGKVTPEQYALQQDRVRRNQPPDQRADKGGPPVTPAPTAAQRRPGVSATPAAPGSAPKIAIGDAAAAAAAPKLPPPTANLTGPPPPVGTPEYAQRMSAALADPSYKAKYSPDSVATKVGLPVAGQKEGIEAYQKQRSDALTEFKDHSTAASTALMQFNAARALLAVDRSRLPITGPIGAMLSRLSALGYKTDTATARQEAAKYLINGAVGGLKETYGAKPGVFDVKINVERAFPNVETMGIDAVRNILDSQITQAQYLKESSERGQQYLQRGMEPSSFATWNEHYFSKANLVTPPVDVAKSDNPQKAYDALKPGDSYLHEGKTLYKGGKPK